ncbi:MAG TPA: YD repeat-containing protein [Syntrophorhabdaceae bacterium]|nr:YD repeat-containing protein [Syntrophorhabdaceae bacterium]HQM81079.1 YD repeat-containing protein [Syntrophorhabdaceae bacterium]
MKNRKGSSALTVWVLAALVLIGASCNAFPAFAEIIFYTYDDLNRLTTVELPETGATRFEYDEAGNRLSKTFTPNVCVPACPGGFTREGNLCHQPAGCPGGALNAQYDMCIHDIRFGCPGGYAYVAERSRCEGPPTCSEGSYDAVHNRCHKPVSKRCSTGYVYAAARDRCERIPSCLSGGSYSAANNRCEAPCASSFTCDCPSGYSWNGVTCTVRATCPNGSLDGDRDVCYRSYTPSCDSGWSLGATSGKVVCYQNASCPSGGVFNPALDVCYTSSTAGCDSGYAWDPAISLCRMLTQCPAGSSYSTARDRCEVAPLPCP